MKDTLTLDVKKWRCGQSGYEGVNALRSTQPTELLNAQGSMCCLGQFALQLGATKKDIKCQPLPESLNFKIKYLSKGKGAETKDSEFSNAAVLINDDSTTTIEEKIKELKALCSKYQIRLVVKNGKKYLKK